MLAIIVLMIIAIVLGGIAAYQLYAVTQTQNLLIQSQKNISTVAMWKTLIISKAKAVGYNNEIVLPYGENKTGYHTVPQWVYFNTKNPWGKDIIYCPFSSVSSGTPNGSINLATGNYQVEVKQDFTTANSGQQRPYVVSSENLGYPTDILAFLISPIPTAVQTPVTCAGLSFNNGTQSYTSPNGLVETITKGDVETFANLSMLSGQPNSPIQSAGTFTNTVSNDSTTDGNTLINNLNYIMSSNVNYAYLKLASGTHTLPNSILNSSNSEFPIRKTLIIEGDNSALTTITSSSTSGLDLNNYDIYLKNVKFDNQFRFSATNSKINTYNTELANVTMKNTEWLIMDNTIVNSDGVLYPISSYASKLFIAPSKTLRVNETSGNNTAINAELSTIVGSSGSTLNLYKAGAQNTIQLLSSELKMDSATLTINSSSNYDEDIYVDDTSNISLYNSIINLSGRSNDGIFSNGHLSLNGSDIITLTGGNKVITLSNNSSAIIRGTSRLSVIGNSNAGSRPSIGIFDDGGAKFVSGNSGVSIYASTKCADGNLFAYSEESLIAGNSTRNDYTSISTSLQPLNSTPLTNSILFLASKTNATNWNCIK